MRLSTQRALLSPPRGRAGRRSAWRREDGQTLVEFALVLPVLLIILTGILKFGMMFNHYITLTDSVRVGARSLALGRGFNGNPCTKPVLQAIGAAAPAVTLTESNITTVFSGGETCMTGVGWFQGDQATMSATYSCDLSILGINLFPGCHLDVSATEAIE